MVRLLATSAAQYMLSKWEHKYKEICSQLHIRRTGVYSAYLWLITDKANIDKNTLRKNEQSKSKWTEIYDIVSGTELAGKIWKKQHL